jgi:hypothetical protein
MGLCMSPNNFGNTQGTRVGALTASAINIMFGAPEPVQATIDAVTSVQSNNCGQTTARWSWVVTPSGSTQTAYFPTDTQVEVSYSCEPNQTYYWTTSSSCFLGIGSCNVKRHARTFFFATQAESNIPAVSSLYGKTDFVPQAGTSYTLACGGYRPENGSKTPPSYGAANKNTGVCIFGIDCGGGGDFAGYNVADSSYWQPGITLSVNVCDDPEDIVVKNVCTPCSTIKPGSHRVENVCVMSTPVLGLSALAGGKPVDTVPAGTRITLQATYGTDKTDPITGVDIVGGAGGAGTSVCGSKSCLSTTYNSAKSAATSTYSFTPTAIGTYTFYPQVKTKTLDALQNYGNVSKTITVTAPCPANATPSSNGCTCKDKYFAYIGNSCVLACPSGLHATAAGNSCVANLPSANDITFTATRVRAGTPSNLSWSIANLQSTGVICDIAPHAGLSSLALSWPAGSVMTVPITQPTVYTLTCGNGADAPVSKDVTISLIPQYQEI